jgi:hypothetical protein
MAVQQNRSEKKKREEKTKKNKKQKTKIGASSATEIHNAFTVHHGLRFSPGKHPSTRVLVFGKRDSHDAIETAKKLKLGFRVAKMNLESVVNDFDLKVKGLEDALRPFLNESFEVGFWMLFVSFVFLFLIVAFSGDAC